MQNYLLLNFCIQVSLISFFFFSFFSFFEKNEFYNLNPSIVALCILGPKTKIEMRFFIGQNLATKSIIDSDYKLT